MRRKAVFAAILLSACSAQSEGRSEYDYYLSRVIAAYDLRPLPTKPFEETPKFKLGQALFFDPILSGSRDIACSTCHMVKYGLSDALPISIGTGGTDLGERRTLPLGRPAQPRNALDLWNRDNNSVKAMFWDGRVEVVAPGVFATPLGDDLPDGFENLMAVQAIFPLTQQNEMLGLPGDMAPKTLPAPHAGRPNELAAGGAGLGEPERTEVVLSLLVRRLVGEEGPPSEPWQAGYRKLFRDAYPSVVADEFSIVELSNALAHFEEVAFATRDAPWDKYLAGDLSAISANAKRGAFLFFGRAGCAVCHNGPLFSDFEFHSVGVPGLGPRYDGRGNDFGRHGVTRQAQDRHKFRTPPLRNVTVTAPYFHNGRARTLEGAIWQHIDPLHYADKYDEAGGFVMTSGEIEAISPVLKIKTTLGDADIADIVTFLRALDDPALAYAGRIVPASVPSKLFIPGQRMSGQQ